MLDNQIKIGKKVWTVNSAYIHLLKRYKHNKKAKVGTVINCSFCKKEFIKEKESYHICSTACKDDFWNKIDPRKRNNNGRNRGQQQYILKEPYWSDDDLAGCDYHNKE